MNYFNRFGRQWQVFVQAEGEARARAKPGYSSEQAMKAMEAAFKESMPDDMGFAYLGMSFQEQQAQQGIGAAPIFAISILFVFLILAAMYESWTLPFSVLLGVPIAIFGAFAGLWIGRFENNIYAQIGMVMLIGLAAKNAILIVEFAKMKHEEGQSLEDAALGSAKMRLRPILMTSFAFILGCVPLALSSGAGALGRQVMGFVVIGGMAAASFIATFFTPMLFFQVERLTGGRMEAKKKQDKSGADNAKSAPPPAEKSAAAHP